MHAQLLRAHASCFQLWPSQERLAAAEAEYSRGLAKLKSSARELESLGARVHSSGKAAHGEPSALDRGGMSLVPFQVASMQRSQELARQR